MIRTLKPVRIRGYILRFYKDTKTGWVRPHIKIKSKLVSSFDSPSEKVALRKARRFLDGMAH